MDQLKSPGKSFDISKREVWEAYLEVRRNKGAPGVDGQSIADFETDLKNNLYRIWNRMSSGTYFPPPVKAVEIPKQHGGGTRTLGVPTVADRIAQTVVARHLMARVERVFHPDSYGYRPGRSALDAVARCRQRCWRSNWVIDLDIRKFFDSVRWDLMLKAVTAHADAVWVLLYVKRWLQAPLALPDGTLQQRDRGTPQGSSVSPVLANLFLHYAFDVWMAREFPNVTFERYVDDAVIHCVTQRQAEQVLAALGDRMEEVGLQLHPAKTRIVYCKDALKKISREVRAWRLHLRTGLTLSQLAKRINPIVRGWMNYYGAFYRTAMWCVLARINTYLLRWIRKKYKRLRMPTMNRRAWQRLTASHPRLFAQWAQVTTCTQKFR